MRLTRLSFENYRSFVDRAKLELRPLTLLFGYNSAGKSAALRMLPILAASTVPGEVATLALNAEAARGASFRDLLSRQSATPTLTVALDYGRGDESLTVQFAIRDLPEHQVQIVERLDVRSGALTIDALWDTHNRDPRALFQQYEFRGSGEGSAVHPMWMEGLRFHPPDDQPFTNVLDRAAAAVGSLADRVHWLNSLRAVPPRSDRFGARPRRMASDGSNAGELLAHDSIAGGELLGETSAWYERATGHRLAVRRYAVAAEEQYSLVLAPVAAETPIEIPIVDTGEGMAQVLAVIVLGCLARLGRLGSDPLLAIEHPELHLHPAAHAELAAFFCALAIQPTAPTTIIETHSENFLLRVQLAIARDEIPASAVIVHWIRALEDGRSAVDTITFDDAARPQGAGWPPGVFAEDTEQARALLQARRERGLV